MALLVLACQLLLAVAEMRISDYQSSFEGDPDVFLIGVQKGGTTSLTSLLVHQLKLYVISGATSEAHFFSAKFNDDEFNKYIAGFNRHRNEFGNLKGFDGSTTYFPSAIVFQRIKDLYSPESLRRKKFILTLREPISRDFSWFTHYYGECKKFRHSYCPNPASPKFHDTFHDYIQRSRGRSKNSEYLQNLKDMLKFIPRDQIFIYNFESITGDEGDDTINRLLYFLGEEAVYRRGNLLPHVNTRSSHYKDREGDEVTHEILCSDIRSLNQTYAALNEGLIDFINKHPDKPVSEPVFLPFTERVSEKCVEDDGSLVYLL